jgi:hypothetical protein
MPVPETSLLKLRIFRQDRIPRPHPKIVCQDVSLEPETILWKRYPHRPLARRLDARFAYPRAWLACEKRLYHRRVRSRPSLTVSDGSANTDANYVAVCGQAFSLST